MAGDDMAAKFVADFERSLEIEAAPGLPARGGRARQRLGADVDLEPGSASQLRRTATTVRQGPPQAIEAPSAIVCAG